MTRPSRSERRIVANTVDRTGRKVAVPFVLVLVLASLLSVVVAVVVECRTARLSAEISEVIEPAQARLGQVQLDLALQIAGGFATPEILMGLSPRRVTRSPAIEAEVSTR